jgi:hypothetical protein
VPRSIRCCKASITRASICSNSTVSLSSVASSIRSGVTLAKRSSACFRQRESLPSPGSEMPEDVPGISLSLRRGGVPVCTQRPVWRGTNGARTDQDHIQPTTISVVRNLPHGHLVQSPRHDDSVIRGSLSEFFEIHPHNPLEVWTSGRSRCTGPCDLSGSTDDRHRNSRAGCELLPEVGDGVTG